MMILLPSSLLVELMDRLVSYSSSWFRLTVLLLLCRRIHGRQHATVQARFKKYMWSESLRSCSPRREKEDSV